MSWTYHQSTGEMYHNGKLVDAHGYSGNGASKNNPHAQNQVLHGPIPQGKYTVGAPFDNRSRPGHHGTGPYSIRLTPNSGNQMYGRSGFLIHGDNVRHPGTASDGCIIVNLRTRHEIIASGDRMLEVVP